MTEQQPVYAPRKRRFLGLWFAGAVVVLGVAVVIVFGVTPEPPPVADSSLEPGLLRSTGSAGPPGPTTGCVHGSDRKRPVCRTVTGVGIVAEKQPMVRRGGEPGSATAIDASAMPPFGGAGACIRGSPNSVENSRTPFFSITIPGLTLARALVHAWPPLTDQVGEYCAGHCLVTARSGPKWTGEEESRMTRDTSRDSWLGTSRPFCHDGVPPIPLRALIATERSSRSEHQHCRYTRSVPHTPARFHAAPWARVGSI
jgi:hypothetical protein